MTDKRSMTAQKPETIQETRSSEDIFEQHISEVPQKTYSSEALRETHSSEAPLETHSPDETWELAFRMGERAEAGQVYTLNGDLGAGKTVFAQGFAAGLGVPEPVNSPTFTIVQEYMGRLPLYHFDVYRIEEPEEMEEIGYREYFYGNGVCLIEWAEQISELLPDRRVDVTISRDPEKDFDYRTITIRKRD